MSTPKVSIIMPSLNVVAYIRECIESAINQTLKDIEIICVDAGSTDGTAEILQEYAAKDSRIHFIHSDVRSYGYQMNLGLDAATGKYICILETDDFVIRDSYEILYTAAEQFGADIVRSDYFDLTTKNGRINLVTKQISQDFSYYYRLICPNKEKEVYSFVMHNWTGIYNKEFLDKYHIRYNETPGASYQDNGFYFQVFSQTNKLVYIPRPCYCYRIDNPGSSIHDKSKVYTMSEEYAFIRNFLANHPDFEQEVLPAFYSRLFRAHYQTYVRIQPEFKPEYCELMRKDMIEARDLHLLDTGLFLPRERELLVYLLKSTDTFMLVTSKGGLKKSFYLMRRMISTNGILSFIKFFKKKMKL